MLKAWMNEADFAASTRSHARSILAPAPAATPLTAATFFFFNDTATTEIYTTHNTLSLHDALPIFSKSVGTVGGFCVSNHPKFEILRLVCRPYVFTASLPPSVVATAATSIRKLMHGSNKRAHLWENSKRLHGGLKALGFTLGTDEPQSAIVAVIMPDLERGAAMWEALLHEGLYVNLARPPATPAGMTLLRCSLCAEHSSEEVETILCMFERAGRTVGII